MKDRKIKCNCTKNGVKCALKINLINYGANEYEATTKKVSVCPLGVAMFNNASRANKVK
ncbi:hypothetical protein [Flavobacterium polysaccharolyticum]|uniref:Uncharacterized protein n=1 Tax=Flavobacterium polysaccharolyticum TaxID=3133148 RepID=A0ABU9NSR6_9FLAO